MSSRFSFTAERSCAPRPSAREKVSTSPGSGRRRNTRTVPRHSRNAAPSASSADLLVERGLSPGQIAERVAAKASPDIRTRQHAPAAQFAHAGERRPNAPHRVFPPALCEGGIRRIPETSRPEVQVASAASALFGARISSSGLRGFSATICRNAYSAAAWSPAPSPASGAANCGDGVPAPRP